MGTRAAAQVRFTSAKVVLVGESNVGKSCMAMRLAYRRYPKPEEIKTTHGLRFWKLGQENDMIPEALGERREIVLWEMGGQDEYRLVHQLFLKDTILALVFFDPSRGRTAFDEVEEWVKRLEKQQSLIQPVKILVGAKMDEPNGDVDQIPIRTIIEKCGFRAYIETSALLNRNIDDLQAQIAESLNWDSLARTSRPELFQQVRDQIEQWRTDGEVVVSFDTLRKTIQERYSGSFDTTSANGIVDILAAQGVIADVRKTEDQRTLVLQIERIEQYAGSLILMARSNPHGVPALEERSIGSQTSTLPRIPADERLPRTQEIVILDCVLELLIQSGICFRQDGLLIFPSLFQDSPTSITPTTNRTVSLYYDFTGAIDNIYASLVARLAVGRVFGDIRLAPDRAEYDDPANGVCGINQIKRKGGLAHLDLSFSENTSETRRNLFISFVEDHLNTNGIEVREHQAIKCQCGFELSEEIVRENLNRGARDVICPVCRTESLISEGVAEIRRHDPAALKKVIALRGAIKKQMSKDVLAATRKISQRDDSNKTMSNQPIRILHLSDLHLTVGSSVDSLRQALLADIKKPAGLGLESVDYLVISGDMTDRGNSAGYEKAHEFVTTLIAELGLSAQRCIFVPGNHDLQDLKGSYDWSNTNKGLNEDAWIKQGEIYLVRDDMVYSHRLLEFSDRFFHKIVQKPYPLEPRDQGIPYLYADARIQFLTLNSGWQIDQFHRKRSSIHPEAIAQLIRNADIQVEDAVKRGELAKDTPVLRIGVWHHAVAGPDAIGSLDFVDLLKNSDVRLCLHGDVHENRAELVNYAQVKHLNVVGAGSFSSAADGRPESTPCLYNLIEVDESLKIIRINTRAKTKANGAWDGLFVWPNKDDDKSRLPYYDIDLTSD